jgi:hypothetical protein
MKIVIQIKLIINSLLYVISYWILSFNHALIQPKNTQIIDWIIIELYDDKYYNYIFSVKIIMITLFVINLLLYFKFIKNNKIINFIFYTSIILLIFFTFIWLWIL